MAKRIYVEADNLTPLVDWLKTKPEGRLMVLIGKSEGDAASLVLDVMGGGRDTIEWIVAKIQAGELNLRAIPDTLSLPIGKIFEG